MGHESMGKKDKEKKKAKKKQQKEERKQERQSNNNKGKSLEDMMAYVDEHGNLSPTPPDPNKKIIVNVEDIELGVPKQREEEPGELIRKGVIKFFNNEKGYGFINDLQSKESVFVHINQLAEPVKEGDKVIFEIEMGPKGPNAVRVKKGV